MITARRSLRAKLTAIAVLVMAVPVTTASFFVVISVWSDLKAPDFNFDQTVTLCLSGEGPAADPGTRCSDRERTVSLGWDAGPGGSDVAPGPAVTYTASYVSSQFVPELSLWPFSGPPREGHRVVEDMNGSIHWLPVSDVSGDEGLVFAQKQRYVNRLVLGVVSCAVVLLLFFARVVWWAAGRTVRPVEEIRREMADITEHDLTRRVPVPRGRNEVAELATTVNATLDRLETAMLDNRRFVADASHELRGPIAALRAELEIATTHPDRADWPAVAHAALADTERLQHLAGDLLLLARLDHTPVADGDAVDLTALVGREVGRRRSRHALATELPDRPVPVRGERALLERLLVNLLDNAERHAAGAVTVRLIADDHRAVLEVLDDGPGIPPEDRERVFDRFTRLDHARTRDTGGTGLGLAIARRIATTHHGALHATDHPHGTGARLVATLPLAP